MKDQLLYQDNGKIWCSLEDLYYSQSSHLILSNHLDQIVEEPIAYYCPQCLNRFQDEELIQHYRKSFTEQSSQSQTDHSKLSHHVYCYCPNCFQCPDCKGVMLKFDQEEEEKKTEANEQNALLVCTNCQQRHHLSFSKITQQNQTQTKCFQELMQFYTQQGQLNKKAHHYDHHHPQHHRSHQQLKKTDRHEPWHIEDVELSLQQKHFKNDNFSVFANEKETESVETASSSFVPQHFLLLNKRTLRSKNDLETGKMNILVQQKQLPLEGDSAMKLHKGKWFLKDSSAVHFLPFIRILQKSMSESMAYFDLKIVNPNEFATTMRIANFVHESLPTRSIPDNHHLVRNDTGKYEFQHKGKEWKLAEVKETEFSLDSYEDEFLKDDFGAAGNDFYSILQQLGKMSEDTTTRNKWSSVSKGNILYLRLPVIPTNDTSVEEEGCPSHNEACFSLEWTLNSTKLLFQIMIQFE
jgi:uncharacterized protein YbaR (Trm112 family)